MKMRPVEEQLRLLMRGVEYGDEGVRQAMEGELRERLAEGRPLRVYLGIDPTAPDLTLGHTVPMRKLRQFQQLGHEAVLVIGGYTALVGDPSDKDTARPMLTSEEIEANARTYAEQAFKVLEPERTVIRNNAEWLSKLTLKELIEIASSFTVGQFLQRENFARRRERGDPIYVHEFFYAFMQAYDAVALETDAQIGATEQLFNLMAGRTLQRAYGQRPQIAVTMPILVGTDGRLRMSKSQGNYIALNDPPAEMYGKVMSLPDQAMLDYFTLATDVPEEEIEEIRRQLTGRSVNPMEVKKRLAREIVGDLHGPEAAGQAEEHFRVTVQEKGLPDEEYMTPLPVHLKTAEESRVAIPQLDSDAAGYGHFMISVLMDTGLFRSRAEVRRAIERGDVSVDGRKLPPMSEFARIKDGSVVEIEGDGPILKEGSLLSITRRGVRVFRIVDADKQS